jgi:hypothetical protein
MSLLPFFEWCNETTLGVTIRDSLWLFPVIEAVHLLGLAVLGGAILLVDLRLFGLGLRTYRTSILARDLHPWMMGGLLVMISTGILLFLSEALKCYENVPFRLKMVFLFLALLFTFTVRRSFTMSDRADVDRTAGRLVAFGSLTLWTGVGLMGRGIGFW